jgi:hypothetical protein
MWAKFKNFLKKLPDSTKEEPKKGIAPLADEECQE